MSDGTRSRAATLIEQLHAEGAPTVRAEPADRYGIHTEKAVGIPMRRMKEIAQPLSPDHDLAAELWASGLYEARIIAALVDDPAAVDIEQMNKWCADFDNWAIVDTVCFHLFDKAPGAWSMIEPWTKGTAELTKRAGFALLWALALHDETAEDDRFLHALSLIRANAADDRHLVTKAQTMALRAIAQKRPAVLPDVLVLARRLATSDDPNARRVGRPIVEASPPATDASAPCRHSVDA